MNKRLIAAAAAVTAVTLALAGCSGSGTASDSQDAGGSAGPADLKIGNFLDVTSWDPGNADIGFDGPYLSAVYDALVAVDKDGKPVPSLATSITVADDDLSIDMDIPTGLTFSDGEALDVDAVVASLEHMKEGPRSGEAYVNVEGFEAVDEDTVRINLSERDDSLLYLMGIGRSYVMSPAAIEAGTLATTPVGSGPYLLDQSTSVAGSEYHFTKVADHWDADTYGFDSVTIYPMVDATARQNAMLSGQINVNYGDENDLDAAKQQGWNIAQRVSGWVGLQFVDHTGAKLEPLGKVEVRQALNYAFDGASILQAVNAGAGEVTNQVFPADGDVNDPALADTYAYNVDKAKKLLADAGYPDGFDVTMPMSPVFAMWQPVAEQALADIGVRVTWDNMQQPDYQTSAASYPMYIAFLAMDGSAVATVGKQVTRKQWFNPNPDYASNPELKALVEEVNTLKGDEQLDAISRLNAKLVELAWFSVWYQADNTYYSVPGITVQPIVGMMLPTLRYITRD